MNFALDLAAGAVSGVTADVRALIRSGGGDPDNPRSAAEAINREVFGRTLSSATLASASSVDTAGPVAVPVRVSGLLFASPEMQVR